MRAVVILGLEFLCTGAQTILLDDARATVHPEDAAKCHSATGAEGDAFHYIVPGSKRNVEKFATYTFDVDRDGCYLIEEYHPVGPEGGCRDSGLIPEVVPLEISYCRGQKAWTSVNQAVAGGKWNMLGRLPFYKTEGDYTISLRENPLNSAPPEERHWMADAFRLTWLAESCHADDIAKAEAEKKPTPRESLSAEAENDDDANQVATEEPEVEETIVAAALQTIMIDPREDGAYSKFFFKVPVDGCYMVEERHPHIDGEKSGSFTINYCKGMTASGVVDHTNGKHDQWNYVAALPFFDDSDGSIILPKELVERGNGQHQVRLTHVGKSCRSSRAEVYRADLRIVADFAGAGLGVQQVADKFKSSLMEMLDSYWLQPEGVHKSRAAITHLREGSIITEITVLPTAHSPSLSGPSSHDAVAELKKAITPSEVQKKICAKAKAQDPPCGVTVFSSGRAKALVSKVDPQEKADEKTDGFNHSILVPIILGSLLLLTAPFCVYRFLLKRRKSNAQPLGPPPEDQDKTILSDVLAVKKDAETQWEDSSTMTPDFDAAPTAEIGDLDHTNDQVKDASSPKRDDMV